MCKIVRNSRGASQRWRAAAPAGRHAADVFARVRAVGSGDRSDSGRQRIRAQKLETRSVAEPANASCTQIGMRVAEICQRLK